jgi:hypothetical protein
MIGGFAWNASIWAGVWLDHGAVATGRPPVLLSVRVMRNCLPIW